MRLQNAFAYTEALGKSKIWQMYANHFAGDEIMEEGFNQYSGYVYIALENGTTIGSCMGQDAVIIIIDYHDVEYMFDTYQEYEEFQIKRYETN